MLFEEFEKTVFEAMEELPAEVKAALNKNAIKILPREKVPPALKEKYASSTVFGVFIGVSHGKFYEYSTEPTRIELYNESFTGIPQKAVKTEIKKTVLHEIGHYLGYNESKIRSFGL